MKKRFLFRKLVRDHIVEDMAAQDVVVAGRTLHKDEAYIPALQAKLKEEVQELLDAATPSEILEECGDVVEVLVALGGLYHLTLEDILQKASTKRAQKGGFDKRCYVDHIDMESHNPRMAYYTQRPLQYPEEALED